ncbi:MAG TPA: hypothetical protein VGI81_06740 [Tepidisphaeraceae bacterium]
MGRPWEYPRWRRTLMQAVMWVILAGTVGLAQLVVVERRRAPIALEAPVQVGPLWVRTPVDWSFATGSNPEAGDLSLVDDNNPSRQLAIGVERNPVGQDLGSQLNHPGAGTQPIDFKGLKQTGVLMAWHRKIRPQGGNWEQVDILLAFTQLPSGYLVEIRLTQMGARLGTADAELVKAVANAITWAGEPPPKRPGPVLPPDQTEVD